MNFKLTDKINFNLIPIEGGITTLDSSKAEIYVVGLRDFYMSETLVTQEVYEEVMKHNPSSVVNPKYPVNNVSWNDTNIFIQELNLRMDKVKFRLPSEAQWEYAAKGGKLSQNYIYAGSNNIDEVAWHSGNGKTLQEVKLKKPNELGLYDMSGNLFEWCSDIYIKDYGEISKNKVYWNPNLHELSKYNSDLRVKRGGAYNFDQENCEIVNRHCSSQYLHFTHVGIRLVYI